MKKTLTRSLALALTLLMLLALAAPALAASKTMIVTTTNAQVRSTPTQTGNNVIGKLTRQDIVVQTGTTGVWSIIEFDGKTAYVLSASLETYRGTQRPPSSYPDYYEPDTSGGSGSTSTATTAYTTGSANVRKGPGTNYSKVAQLKKGTAVQQVGTVGNWAMIEWNDGVAYISRSLLTSSGSSGGSSGGSVGGSGTVTATANVNVRSGPGTKYSIIGWMAKGESANKTGSSGNWTIISYNGGKGYVNTSYLTGGGSGSGSSGGSTGSTGQTLYARVNTAVRYGPGTSFRAVGYLSPNQRVEYLGKDGNWYRVRFGSHTNVYVYSGDVRFVGDADPGYNAGGYVYASSTVRVYDNATTYATVIGYLYNGDSAERTGVYGSYTRIRYRGGTGYVLTSQVTVGSGSGSSGGDYSYISSWMYSRYRDAACYTRPTESNSYLHGYLGLNERVWAVEGDRYWTKIKVNGYTLYTRTSNLADGYTGGGGYPGGWVPSGQYGFINSTAIVYNASGTPLKDLAGVTIELPRSTMVRIVGEDTYSWEVVFSYTDTGDANKVKSGIGYVLKNQIS